MSVDLEALKESYYEYIEKVPAGVQTILALYAQQETQQVFQSLANLAEGVEALYLIEQAFEQQGYKINSRLKEAVGIMEEISQMLQEQSLGQLEATLKKLTQIFISGTEWTFVK